MKVTIDIDAETWKVLEPILGPMVVKGEICDPDNHPIDIEEILSLNNGIRIANLLLSETEDVVDDYGRLKGKRGKRVRTKTVGDLKRLTQEEFMRWEHAGKKTWEQLEAYIQTL